MDSGSDHLAAKAVAVKHFVRMGSCLLVYFVGPELYAMSVAVSIAVVAVAGKKRQWK
jgi:hypothetical protein